MKWQNLPLTGFQKTRTVINGLKILVRKRNLAGWSQPMRWQRCSSRGLAISTIQYYLTTPELSLESTRPCQKIFPKKRPPQSKKKEKDNTGCPTHLPSRAPPLHCLHSLPRITQAPPLPLSRRPPHRRRSHPTKTSMLVAISPHGLLYARSHFQSRHRLQTLARSPDQIEIPSAPLVSLTPR
jgi:hypothetical protein